MFIMTGHLAEWNKKIVEFINAFMNYCSQVGKIWNHYVENVAVDHRDAAKSTKWKCFLQEPGHHLWIEGEGAVGIGPKSDCLLS